MNSINRLLFFKKKLYFLNANNSKNISQLLYTGELFNLIKISVCVNLQCVRKLILLFV